MFRPTTAILAITISYIGLLCAPISAAPIFGVKSRSGGGGSVTPANLFRLEVDGTGFVDLGAITLSAVNIDVDGLAITRPGELFGFQVSGGNSTLLSIDPVTAVATTIGPGLTARDIRGATFDWSGVLRVVDSTNNEILQINPVTGTVVGSGVPLTLAGNPFDVSNSTDIAQRSNGAYFLVDATNIYNMDLATGVLTLASTDPGQGLAGAAFSSDANSAALFAYEVNGTDDVFRYDINSAFARTTLAANIIAAFNSGRGDLAAISLPEPASFLVSAIAATMVLGLRIMSSRQRG